MGAVSGELRVAWAWVAGCSAAALACADLVTTRLGLDRGAVEENPLLAPGGVRTVAVKVALGSSACALVWAAGRVSAWGTAVAATLCVLVQVPVVASNVSVLRVLG